ncbi:MAG: hypothetical protein HY898_08285 [Deltaproteobacteria bacterium]|nr:hypothetical protein [Deltaproteobacteria bacterium]
MRALASCQAITVLLTASSFAIAQPPPAPAEPASAAPPAPVQAVPPSRPTLPVAPANAPAQTVPSSRSTVPAAPANVPAIGSCSLGSHDGIADADAVTASQLVCDEIQRQFPGNRGTFVVELRKLGSGSLLVLTQLDERGSVADRRQLRMDRIEETVWAAPRLVESLITRTSIGTTARVDNIVGEDARELRKRSGQTHVGAGIIGSAFIGGNGIVAPGVDLALYHETERVAVGGDLRLSYRSQGSNGDEKGASMYALSVGGRYFTSSEDITPYFGGGLSWSSISFTGVEYTASESGLSAYAEGGVEALRTHRTRILLGLRATLPFYAPKNERYPGYYPGLGSNPTPVKQEEARYTVPLTINATVMF